jgi:transcriptional regulator with PAS, ATPase and Fis domain
MSNQQHTLTTLRRDTMLVPSLEVFAMRPDGHAGVVPLGIEPIVVGTSPDADIVIDDPHVSRRHCEFSVGERGVRLRDCGSKNGTLVGGLEITDALVPPGAVVQVGQWRLTVRITGAPREVSLSRSARFGEALGGTLIMRALFSRLEMGAATDETILLLGESGTGKELLAKAIHDASPRRDAPFRVFDCSAIAPTLIEAELFGVVKGAFTGAVADRPGMLEVTHGGTLFLDEIGELPVDLQPKLLRALEARQFRRLGANSWHSFDARIVAATHRDLAGRIREGTFRQDLYYRLAVIEARVPPLRERRDDIELLVDRFLASRDPPLTLRDLPPNGLELLRAHDWPGNVRELRNVLARMIVFQDASQKLLDPPIASAPSLTNLPLREARQQVVEAFEQNYLVALLRAHAGNVTRAAETAGVSRQFFHRLMERYGIRSTDT